MVRSHHSTTRTRKHCGTTWMTGKWRCRASVSWAESAWSLAPAVRQLVAAHLAALTALPPPLIGCRLFPQRRQISEQLCGLLDRRQGLALG